ncbi:MAG: YqjF family protein [Marmoricola sp.]
MAAPDAGPRGHGGRPIEAAGEPLASRPIMTQWWRNISFVHWPVAPERVAPLLPRGVRPDLYDGAAWVGLIPFHMIDAGVGAGRPVPWLGTFLETNVRLYSVDDAGRRGVVFRSLDADRALVVAAARALFGTPYRWARITASHEAGRHRYETHRRAPGRSGPHSVLEVETLTDVVEPTDLELFLTARFGLHTSILGRTWWVPNTHGPWPLRRARLLHLDDELVAAAGLPGVVGDAPASVLHSAGVRTRFGLPVRL